MGLIRRNDILLTLSILYQIKWSWGHILSNDLQPNSFGYHLHHHDTVLDLDNYALTKYSAPYSTDGPRIAQIQIV